MRQLLLVVVCLSALLFPNLASTATQRDSAHASHSTGPHGIVHPQIDGQPVGSSGVARPAAATAGLAGPKHADNLTYQGGPVMRTNTNYAIYWVPSGFTTASNYKTVVDGYFANVAADSGATTNVYSASRQYSDTTGSIAYDSTFGGSAVDTQTFPSNGCTNPSTVIGASKCLSDNQLQAEVKRFADAQGWPHGPDVEFFLFTASGVGSCYDASDCAYDVYCAYHSEFDSGSTSSEYIYANMPWPNQSVNFGGGTFGSDCDGGEHPNGSGSSLNALNAADEVLGVTSHESNESITDPLGDAWWVANGSSAYFGEENGDLCAWYFPDSAVLGSTATGEYNQQIGSGKYFIQGEWSNASSTTTANSGCVWSFGTAAPANTVAPTITGTATLGQVLTAHAGTWSHVPTSYSYQWQRCDSGGAGCSSLGTAVSTSVTTVTRTLVSADVGHTLKVQVTASNSGGAGSAATSGATGVVDSNLPLYSSGVAITGTESVGQALTAHAGTWSHLPTSYSYQWQRCDSGGGSCSSLGIAVSTSATTVTRTLVAADGGHTLRVVVTGKNSSGSGSAATSDATGVVDSGLPAYSSGVGITGTTTVAHVLTGTAGSWTHSPTKFTYVWQRCDSGGGSCSTIATVTKSALTSVTYTLVAADDKHTIKLSVTAFNTVGNGSAQVSGATSVVNGEPVYSTGFSLTGTATVGATLTANAGSWTNTPTKYTYTWKRCDASGNNCNTTISNSTTSSTTGTYKLLAADDRHTVIVSVSAQNAAGMGSAQTSSATGIVNGEPVNTVLPSITGTATVGQTLTAHTGAWTNSPTKFTYTWQRCDALGSNCNTISATSSTYKLVALDHNHTLKVTVTASNTAGASDAKQSAATSVVP
jgi:hypothetical protein